MSDSPGAALRDLRERKPLIHQITNYVVMNETANAAGVPVVLDPVGVGATRLRTDAAKRILAEVDVAIVRGNAAEVAALAGLEAEIRGVEAIGAAAGGLAIARTAASGLGVVASVTGPVDHVSDGTRTLAVSNGDPLLAAITGCFVAVRTDAPVDAAAFALAAFGVAAEDAARGADGPGTFHARLYDTLYALTPESLDERANIRDA